jgi:hypothetical protein
MRRFCQTVIVVPLLLAASVGMASAESVPFACEMQPDHQTIRIVLSNPAGRERSCIASCQFQTPLYGGEVQVICAHPVAADAREIEMCTRDSGGQQLIKQTFGSADCYNY